REHEGRAVGGAPASRPGGGRAQVGLEEPLAPAAQGLALGPNPHSPRRDGRRGAAPAGQRLRRALPRQVPEHAATLRRAGPPAADRGGPRLRAGVPPEAAAAAPSAALGLTRLRSVKIPGFRGGRWTVVVDSFGSASTLKPHRA